MNKGLKKLCILATVISVGVGGYKVYAANSNSSEDTTNTVSTEKGTSKKSSSSFTDYEVATNDVTEKEETTTNETETTENTENTEQASASNETESTQSTTNQASTQETKTVQASTSATNVSQVPSTSSYVEKNTQSTQPTKTTSNSTNIFKNIKNYNVYYGNDYSDEIINKMANYDVMIVLPTSVPDTATLRKIQAKGVKVYAYVTFGEISKTDNEVLSNLTESDYLHINNNRVQNYGCDLADIRSTSYKNLMMSIIQKRVASAGYDGLFIDTLDDYEFTSVLQTEALVDEMTTEAASLIKRIHTEFPNLSLIVNRAFTAVEKCDQRYADAILYECMQVIENDGYFQKLVKSVDSFTEKGGVCLSLSTDKDQEQLGIQKAKEKGWIHYYRPDEDYSTWYDYSNN